MGIESLFVVFERQANKVSGWCSLSMLLNFRRVRLLLERLYFLLRFLFLFSCL